MSLEYLPAPDLDFYCRLFRQVGDPWRWSDRRLLAPEALAALFADPQYELWILRVAAKAMGFFELDYRRPAQAELVYFGLITEGIGKGLGRWLMSKVLERAWSRPLSRLWLHTCELDHPGALAFYQRSGFEIYCEKREKGPDPAAAYLW